MSKSSEFRVKVNPALLLWARQTMGVSRAAAAKNAHLDDRYLERAERGQQALLYEELGRLAKIYRRPYTFFMLSEPPAEKPFPTDFRSIGSKGPESLGEKVILAIRKARRLAMSAVELREAMGSPMPRFSLRADLSESADTAAQRVRAQLPLDFLYEKSNAESRFEQAATLLEAQGILVFRLNIGQDDVRGFSLIDEAMPVIVVKKGDEVQARLFTLFHELGHILLRQGGICDLSESQPTEVWCNRLAGSLLLPFERLLNNKEVLEQQSSGHPAWDNKNLGKLAREFGVSRFVVLRRLVAAGLAQPEFYHQKHREWLAQLSKKKVFASGGGPPDLPKRSLTERGKTFADLTLRALDKQKISLLEAAEYLDVPVGELGKVRDYLTLDVGR